MRVGDNSKKKNEGDSDCAGVRLLRCWDRFEYWIRASCFFRGAQSERAGDRERERGSAFSCGE